ncbi:MAG: ankyrin repeat domain-containing protein [Candidatus Cardinium sp.]
MQSISGNSDGNGARELINDDPNYESGLTLSSVNIARYDLRYVEGQKAALCKSIEEHNIDFLKALLSCIKSEQVFSLKFDSNKYTILHYAVVAGNLDIVKFLISKYIEIKEAQGVTYSSESSDLKQIIDNKGNTLLHYAAHTCNDDIIKYLMTSGADYTVLNQSGISPLLIALGRCDLVMVKLFLDKNFPINQSKSLELNVNKQVTEGLTPLGLAVWCTQPVIIRSILDFYKKFGKYDKHPDLKESRTNIEAIDSFIVEELLSVGANPEIQDGLDQNVFHRLTKGIPTDPLDTFENFGNGLLERDFEGHSPIDSMVRQLYVLLFEKRYGNMQNISQMLVCMLIGILRFAVSDSEVNGNPRSNLSIREAVILAYEGSKKEGRGAFEEKMVEWFRHYNIPSELTSPPRTKKSRFSHGHGGSSDRAQMTKKRVKNLKSVMNPVVLIK